jgi:hypothetical protein
MALKLRSFGQILAARLGPLDAQAKLEVLFVADQDIGHPRDLRKNVVQLLLAAFPERGAVVQVERDAGAVLLCGSGKLQAKRAGFRR